MVFAARRPRPVSEPSEERVADVDGSVAPPEPSPAPASVIEATEAAEPPRAARRSARIVASSSPTADAARVERERLLGRLVASEGRAMITRAANECQRAGVEFPLEQAVQLQLLEHVDEAFARAAMAALGRIFSAEAPTKRPILEQRLRRLEDTADEEATRVAAAELRRSLRA
jgi:hypothetical protein